MPNLPGAASTTQELQLEALNEVIKLLIEKEAKLDSRISERGSITPVSLRSFRIRFQTAFPGNVAMFNLDGGILPAGNFSQWVQGTDDSSGLCDSSRILAAGGHCWRGWPQGGLGKPGHQDAGRRCRADGEEPRPVPAAGG